MMTMCALRFAGCSQGASVHFSQFWTADERLETNYAASSRSGFINMQGAKSHLVSNHLLPTVDAACQMNDGKLALCVKSFDLCAAGKGESSLPPCCKR